MKQPKDKRPPIFLEGQVRAVEEARADLLSKQGWRCVRCGEACKGKLVVVHQDCALPGFQP